VLGDHRLTKDSPAMATQFGFDGVPRNCYLRKLKIDRHMT
jgi:hypothetical protein